MTIYSFTGDNRFLSNFYPCVVNVRWKDEVIPVASAEHAYQATKCLNRPDFDKICAAKTPGQAKRLGKKVVALPEWDRIRISVMREILLRKFSDKVLKKMLMDTGREELIEGNTWKDRFWGVYQGEGQNNLGKLLMDIRTDFFMWR